MIRIMKTSDLAQCGRIYAKAFPIEHWGIDWTAENATVQSDTDPACKTG